MCTKCIEPNLGYVSSVDLLKQKYSNGCWESLQKGTNLLLLTSDVASHRLK